MFLRSTHYTYMYQRLFLGHRVIALVYDWQVNCFFVMKVYLTIYCRSNQHPFGWMEPNGRCPVSILMIIPFYGQVDEIGVAR